ncbi:MAG: aldolase/citrate lyase family protein [Acidobacteriota bacterium]|jgi:citrate lyase subunit beta/citryl-CoA lyase
MSAAKEAPPNRGEAGHTGEEVRSDLLVAVELTDSGGIQVEMTSSIGKLYQKSVEAAVAKVLGGLGVADAVVEIDDLGALPFTVEARIEAAARAAGAGGRSLPETSLAVRQRSARDALRRSRLYLPGSQPKFMINAGLHHPDAVILDLEDSVHPDDKPAARVLVRNALRCIDFMGAERMVRINQLPLGLEDLDEIVPQSPDLILIPKVEQSDEVTRVAEHIAALQEEEGGGEPIWIMPILESALGIENAFDIVSAADTVVALTIGLEDYTADLGVVKSLDGSESWYARTRLVNAAKAAGVQAIDSVFGDVEDLDGLASWATASRALGFEGMGCIHPRQIPVIHGAFAPSEIEIDKALAIVAAFEEAESEGLGVVSLGSKMIDPPVVLRAQRLVATARRSGLIADTAGGENRTTGVAVAGEAKAAGDGAGERGKSGGEQ